MSKKFKISLTTKIISILVLLGFLVAVSCGLVGYIKFTNVLTETYSKDTTRVGEIIVDILDTNEVYQSFNELASANSETEIEQIEKNKVYSSSYSELLRFLDDLRRNTDVTDVFIADFKDDNNNIVADGIYYAGVSGERVDPEISIIGENILLANSLDIIENIYTTGETPDIQEAVETEYGPVMNAYIPIIRRSEVIGIVGVQEPMTNLINARNDYILNVALFSLIVTGLVIIIFIFANKKILVEPLGKITNAASTFVTNNNSLAKELNTIKTNDELQTLAQTFIKMEEDINNYIDNLAKVTSEKERVQTELNLAQEIQKNMLPSIFPPFPEKNEFEIYATMEPAKEVGGDFYDFFLIDNDHLGFVMADVSGKGVPAALFMVIAKTLIKDHAQLGLSPAEVFTTVNNILCESNGADLFVTAWLGILNLKTGKLTYANAGHNPPVIKRNNSDFEYLKQRGGLVLAGLENIKYKQFELDLNPGDKIYLYTDGVTEAQNLSEELYGEDRLLSVLNKNKEVNATELLARVRENITSFVKEAEQFDDITMLGIDLFDLSKGEENE